MSRVALLKDIRGMFDNLSPGWREAMRRQADEVCPGWTHIPLRVRWRDGSEMEVALLANPERVPEPSEADADG